MRSRNLIIGLVCFLIVVVVLSMSTKSQKPEETPLYEPILIGTGGDPHWSPDGTKLAYVYKGALYVANADGKGEKLRITELPPTTIGFDWLDSNQFIITGKERTEERGKRRFHGWIKILTIGGEIKTIAEDLRTASPPIFLNDGTAGYYYRDPDIKGEKIFQTIKEGTLSADSAQKQFIATNIGADVWLESVDGNIKRKIASRYYSFPQLSKDGTKILAVCGIICGMCVLDLEGNHTCIGKKPIQYIDPSDSAKISQWSMGPPQAKLSPDGKKVAYAYVTTKRIGEDNFVFLESDIFIENVDGTGRKQITDTSDSMEGNPVWSPDARRIAYTDGTTSKIYLIKIE
jgi:Tol biopolymer transport system component